MKKERKQSTMSPTDSGKINGKKKIFITPIRNHFSFTQFA